MRAHLKRKNYFLDERKIQRVKRILRAAARRAGRRPAPVPMRKKGAPQLQTSPNLSDPSRITVRPPKGESRPGGLYAQPQVLHFLVLCGSQAGRNRSSPDRGPERSHLRAHLLNRHPAAQVTDQVVCSRFSGRIFRSKACGDGSGHFPRSFPRNYRSSMHCLKSEKN
jgi:hypothetical protein